MHTQVEAVGDIESSRPVGALPLSSPERAIRTS